MPKKPASVVSRLCAACALLYFSGVAQAAPQNITELPLSADSDSQWSLPAGEYQGQFLIDQPIHLRCAEGAVLSGQGSGHLIEIKAPDVTLENCTLQNWGQNLTELDSGIFVHPQAERTMLRGNTLRGPGFGIWIDRANSVSVIGNDLQGDEALRSQDRGNGIHIFSAKGARIAGNRVRHARDGVYIGNSSGNQIEGNTLEDLRYGVHYMFSHDNRVIGNVTRNTRTGYALMQSRQLTVIGNRSEHDQNYGFLMNYITYSTVSNNVVTHAHQGSTGDNMISGAEGKALFIYNSLFNTIENNQFQHSGLGIHLTAGSENNKISRNAFVGNQQQVKYVATRTQEWSVDGQGNYWSDYLGWDRDNNGIGDVSYEPNDNIDRLLWLYPQVRLLMNSPAIELLRWVQRVFPVIRSPGVQDSYPLMKLPADSPAQAQETIR